MFTPPLFGRGVSVSNTNTDAIDLKVFKEFCTAIQYHHHRTNESRCGLKGSQSIKFSTLIRR